MISRSLLTAVALATLPLAAPAQSLSEDDVKRLALEAILENPGIIMEAVELLRQQEESAAAQAADEALTTGRALLEQDPNAPVLGNPNGDVTIVEFFDYNCPYCRRAGEQVHEALAADPNIRVVYREWPILGDGSVIAARAALAARTQDAYGALHEALMTAQGRLDEARVMAIAADLGLDTDRLRADMNAPEVDAHIETSMQLANALGFTGTPSFVIGETLAPGLIEADQILEAVADVRAQN